MIKKISSWLNNISKTWIMILTLAVMVLFMITVLPNQAASAEHTTGSHQSPDTSFFYSPGDLLQMADEYGEKGREAYIRSRWTFDLLFPLVYVSFMAVGISWFIQHLNYPPDWVGYANLLPILGGLFDYLENSGTSLLMSLYPDLVPGLPLFTSIISATKWLLVGGSFLIYFILAFVALYQWIRDLIEN